MGVTAGAILYGLISPVQVCAALNSAGYASSPLSEHSPDAATVSVTQKDGVVRQVWVFRDSSDDSDVYAGLRTAIHLGSHGESSAIVSLLAEEFGGYHHNADDDPFIRVVGRNQVTLSPLEELRIALGRTMTMELADGFAKAVADVPGALEDVRDALDAYAATVASAPTPR